MIEYPCGCLNFKDLLYDVLRCHKKCRHHVEWVQKQPTGLAYYQMLGSVNADGAPLPDAYVREITESLGPVPKAGQPWFDNEGDLVVPTAGEIGCGASPYVKMVRDAGYFYVGLDPDPWVVEWMKKTYDAYVYKGLWPVKDGIGIQKGGVLDFLLCTHALEHMDDAPASLDEMYNHLRPGGHLWIVVPDDTDQTNPDHRWFFTLEGLVGMVKRAGFDRVFATQKKVIERENFIYLSARRPG
jgi:SAM-dependent methyltransferase